MTLVLLDTNAYLRLAKRVRPMLGVKFGQKEYVLTVLKDVETEVHRNPTLRAKYPWFDGDDVRAERLVRIPVKTDQTFQFKNYRAFSSNDGRRLRSKLGHGFQLVRRVTSAAAK